MLITDAEFILTLLEDEPETASLDQALSDFDTDTLDDDLLEDLAAALMG